MPGAPDNDGGPWWNAGDSEFSGATPLFPNGDSAAAEADTDPAGGHEYPEAGSDTDATSSDGSAGSPIMEALKLASALADWSQQTGLTDTLKALAAEAAESLSAQASTPEAPDGPGSAAEPQAADSTDVGDDTEGTDPGLSRILGHLWEVPTSDDESGSAASSCEFCPLCRGLDVMRTVQPQVAVGLAEAMASVTEALNTAVVAFTDNQRNKRYP